MTTDCLGWYLSLDIKAAKKISPNTYACHENKRKCNTMHINSAAYAYQLIISPLCVSIISLS